MFSKQTPFKQNILTKKYKHTLMKKIFNNAFNNESFEVNFTKHDISKYDVLYHVTTLDRLNDIKEEGLKISKDLYKSLIKTNMIFLSYPIAHDTSDLFRCYDDSIIIVLDAEALYNEGFCFYDDYFSKQDQSSNKNHLCCNIDIPKEFIKKIIDLSN